MHVPPRVLRHQRQKGSPPTILRKMWNYEVQSGGATRGGRLRGGSPNRHKFIALDARGNARLAVVRGFYPYNLSVTTAVHVAGGNHLLRQGQNKITLVSTLKCSFGQKVQAAVAHVTSVRCQFRAVCIMCHHPNGQGHDKASRFAPVRQITHLYPLELDRGRK